MLVKGAILFLLAMVAIGLVGKLLFPGALSRQARRRLTARRAATCEECGRPVIGRTCDCGKKG